MMTYPAAANPKAASRRCLFTVLRDGYLRNGYLKWHAKGVKPDTGSKEEGERAAINTQHLMCFTHVVKNIGERLY
jgi:hypothetical protein